MIIVKMDMLVHVRSVKVNTINCGTCLKKEAQAGIHKVFVNPDLAKFTPRQLIEELRGRGYTGELKYTQTIKI